MQLPLIVPQRFRIIAHRGASAYAPENTMAAFALADRLGAREIELDVQASRDGVLVVCHDRSLERFGYPDVRIAQTSSEELARLDMGSWFSPHFFAGEPMPTLDEVLDRFGGNRVLHIEIKEPLPGIEAMLLDCLSMRRGLQWFITSFHFDALSRVRQLSESARLGWLTRENGLSSEHVSRAEAIGCAQICPRASDVTADAVARAHERISEVRAHHVKTLQDIERVLHAGCDGATLDHPDWVVHVGAGSNQPSPG